LDDSALGREHDKAAQDDKSRHGVTAAAAGGEGTPSSRSVEMTLIGIALDEAEIPRITTRRIVGGMCDEAICSALELSINLSDE
jgi:hypothetical protein